MDVADLKQQARGLEQQGQTAEALKLFRRILKELEGTPAIIRELPLYVKVGDLALKLRDTKTAVAMYDRAAQHYSAAGKSQSVIALSAKILRSAPQWTYVFPRYARLMMERGHISSGRDVLLHYAEQTGLEKTHEMLQQMGHQTEDQIQPVLAMLVEVADRAERAVLAGQRVKSDEHAVDPKNMPDEAPPAASGEGNDDPVVAETEDATASEPAPAMATRRTPIIGSAEQNEPPWRQAATSTLKEGSEAQLKVVSSAPQRTHRAPRHLDFAMGVKNGKKPTAMWVGAATVVVLVGGAAALTLLDVIPLGGSPQVSAPPTTPVARDPQQSPVDNGATRDSRPTVANAVDSAGPPLREPAPERTEGDAASSDSGSVNSAPLEPAVIAPIPVPTAPVVTPPTVSPSTTGSASQPVVVDGLPVENIESFTVAGQSGYRAVQVLASGERLTLTARPLGRDTVNAPDAGQVSVVQTPGDSVVGTVRFGAFMIYARGRVSADSLEVLLSRLVEVPRPE